MFLTQNPSMRTARELTLTLGLKQDAGSSHTVLGERERAAVQR